MQGKIKITQKRQSLIVSRITYNLVGTDDRKLSSIGIKTGGVFGETCVISDMIRAG